MTKATVKSASKAMGPPAGAAFRRKSPILPATNIASRSLVAVVAIMTFLSCLTLGAVVMVAETAANWQSQISREATIQIRPDENIDIEVALESAASVAEGFVGVISTEIVDRQSTASLLEPWLGTGFDMDVLPVPRLVVITIDEGNPPDFEAMRSLLESQVDNVTLDDHRSWADHLVAMSRTTTTVGIGVLVLMLAATVLTVVFATRGAMSSSRPIIDVLHFVGAEARFIAAEFRTHFLRIALMGSAAGGFAAVAVFLVSGWWTASHRASPGADQTAAFLGSMSLGLFGYALIAIIVIVISLLTAITTHLTVVTHLAELDEAAG